MMPFAARRAHTAADERARRAGWPREYQLRQRRLPGSHANRRPTKGLRLISPQANKYEVKPFLADYDPLRDGALPDRVYHAIPTILFALEESSFLARLVCGSGRALTLRIKDASGADVLVVRRPFRLTTFIGLPCLCGCYLCPQEATVASTSSDDVSRGPAVGAVVQTHRNCTCSHYLDVLDASGDKTFLLEGYMSPIPCCPGRPNICCRTAEFTVHSPNGSPTGGAIANVWGGCNIRNCCARANNLYILFPPSASPEERALLLASAFLVDVRC